MSANDRFRPVLASSLHFSPHGETKCVRGPSGRGASRLVRAGVLEQYVEHSKQAQRSPGGRIACFGRRLVRNAGKRYPRVVRGKPHALGANESVVRLSGRLVNHGVSVAGGLSHGINVSVDGADTALANRLGFQIALLLGRRAPCPVRSSVSWTTSNGLAPV